MSKAICTRKKCKRKGKPQTINNFWNYGRNRWCRECINENRLKWYRENKEKVNKYNREWYQENRERRLSQYRAKYDPKKRREEAAKYRYGISVSKLKEMTKRQKNLCAICNRKESLKDHRTGKTRNLSIDHCHRSGEVRGLLCGGCNRILGLAKDSIPTLKKAIKYLESM